MSLTATPDGPSVLLHITGRNAYDYATITRVDPDGVERPVRSATEVQLVAGEWVGYDYDAPLGVPLTYRASIYDSTRTVLKRWDFANSTEEWTGLGYTVTQAVQAGAPSLRVEDTSGGVVPGGGLYASSGSSTGFLSTPVRSKWWTVEYLFSGTVGAAQDYTVQLTGTVSRNADGSYPAWAPLGTFTQNLAPVTNPNTAGVVQRRSVLLDAAVASIRVRFQRSAASVGNGFYLDYARLIYGSQADTGADDVVDVADATVPVSSVGVALLHDPLDPSGLQTLHMEGIDSLARESKAGVYEIVGSSYPVVVQAARGSRAGSLRVFTATLDERNALWALLDEVNVVLLRTDPSFGVGNLYMVVQNVTEERVTRLGWYPQRRFTLEFIETDAPAGAAISALNNSWQAVLTGYSTWGALLNARASWSTVLTEPA